MFSHYLTMFYSLVIFTLIVSNSWGAQTEKIVKSIGQSFSFDCKQDESIYFGRRLDDWSEVQENNEENSYLNLRLSYLPKENVLRAASDSIQAEHAGYYGCRKATWSTTAMNRIYQLILADVESFYWTYICHGPAGSCRRSDDPTDETVSTFEVADRTSMDLFCCASVIGYEKIDVYMNSIGENRGKIDVKRKQELDGSWVVCANQHTVLKRTSSRDQQTLTCELKTNNQVYSSLMSVVVMKDAMPVDPDILNPSDGSNTNDGGYFDNSKPSVAGRGRRLLTGKLIGIIIGSVIGGLLFLGLVVGLVFFLFYKKKASTKSRTEKSHQYSPVNKHNISGAKDQSQEEESIYIEPTPMYVNAPISLRL